MKVLAIDPGFERLGIAILEKKDGDQQETVLYSDCFLTPKEKVFSDRVLLLGAEVGRVIQKYSPTSLAIESLFFNTNQKSVMNVSEARGVVIYEAKRRSLDVFEYTPLQIKIAVTGYGRSDKAQVIDMVERLLTLKTKPKYDDEYDALAVGLTHFASYRSKEPS